MIDVLLLLERAAMDLLPPKDEKGPVHRIIQRMETLERTSTKILLGVMKVVLQNWVVELWRFLSLPIFVMEDLDVEASAETFSKMINLRLLRVSKVHLPHGLNVLSSKLRLIE
ncbi:hypothetical protein SO802_000152 [Lithocarpus litseifolius]|uniref:Uncharacterized protein n=1 Tax=Lithocarpus litseifolius TaxID=425828 RepID=A0AAW2DR67_9ROSI